MSNVSVFERMQGKTENDRDHSLNCFILLCHNWDFIAVGTSSGTEYQSCWRLQTSIEVRMPSSIVNVEPFKP